MLKTKTDRSVALLLALVMAVAIVTPAFAAGEDYTTVTGTWESNDVRAVKVMQLVGYSDPANPSVVVVPGGKAWVQGITIRFNTIDNPNMTVISLPKEISDIGSGNGVEDCTKIVYRGTKTDWSNHRPSVAFEEFYPHRIPVVTLDGELIDYVGPEWQPATSGPLATKEYLAMVAMMDQYPNGSAWSSNDYYAWHGGIWPGANACSGFAFMLSDAAFGDLPARQVYDFQYSDVRVGDIIFTQNYHHAVIALEVYDDYVVTAEGNYGGRILWGDKMVKSQVEKAECIIVRYPKEPEKPVEPEKPEVPVVPAITFSDVPSDAWYAEAVSWAVAKGITNGTGADTFSPQKICTNAEIITAMWRAAGCPETNAELPFTPKNAWAADALRWAYKKGVFYSSFDEQASCTRYTAVEYMRIALGGPYLGGYDTPFTDLGNRSRLPVCWAVSKGIVKGTSATTFSPDLVCDRATIMTMLYRCCGK